MAGAAERRGCFDAIKLERRYSAGDPSLTRDATVAVAASSATPPRPRHAEGVDTAEQRDRVERLGCGLGQGWHFGRPVGAHEFDALLALTGRARGFVEQAERDRAHDCVLARVDTELAVDRADV